MRWGSFSAGRLYATGATLRRLPGAYHRQYNTGVAAYTSTTHSKAGITLTYGTVRSSTPFHYCYDLTAQPLRRGYYARGYRHLQTAPPAHAARNTNPRHTNNTGT